MGMLKFSDGVKIDTSGPIHIMKLADGWYIIGEGKLIPVNDREEGEKIIATMVAIRKLND